MNMPDIRKKHLGVGLDVEIYAKMRQFAADKGISVTDAARMAMAESFRRIILRRESVEWMNEEISMNRRKRDARSRKRRGVVQ